MEGLDSTLFQSNRGSVYVEQIVLISTVAIGFVAAAVPLGIVLAKYHDLIELVLSLPIP